MDISNKNDDDYKKESQYKGRDDTFHKFVIPIVVKYRSWISLGLIILIILLLINILITGIALGTKAVFSIIAALIITSLSATSSIIDMIYS